VAGEPFVQRGIAGDIMAYGLFCSNDQHERLHLDEETVELVTGLDME